MILRWAFSLVFCLLSKNFTSSSGLVPIRHDSSRNESIYNTRIYRRTLQFTNSHCPMHQDFCQESIRKLASSSLKITSTVQKHQKTPDAKQQKASVVIKPRLMKTSQKVFI